MALVRTRSSYRQGRSSGKFTRFRRQTSEISYDFSELVAFYGQLEELEHYTKHQLMLDVVNEIAQRVLEKVIEKTPTGKHPRSIRFTANLPEREVEFTTRNGERVEFTARAKKIKVRFKNGKRIPGGTLRRGWRIEAVQILYGEEYYRLDVVNDVEYAAYVEHGHRIVGRNGKVYGWKPGRHMLKISVAEVEEEIPGIVEKQLRAIMGG